MLKLRGIRKILIGFVCFFFLVSVWFILTRDQTPQQKLVFPSPESVFLIFKSRWIQLLQFSFTTWYRVLFGLIIGSLVGFLVGLVMTWSHWIHSILDPFIEMVRPVPPIALTPFFILWFGLGDFGQLLLVALGCFMVTVVTTIVSVQNVDPIYARAAKSLGANDLDLYLTIFIPAITPNLLPGLRVAAASSFSLTVAAEYLGAQGGLGFLIRNARTTLQTDTILLATILLGLESFITDYTLRLLFQKLTHWLPKSIET